MCRGQVPHTLLVSEGQAVGLRTCGPGQEQAVPEDEGWALLPVTAQHVGNR
jgi:hypothetical protein